MESEDVLVGALIGCLVAFTLVVAGNSKISEPQKPSRKLLQRRLDDLLAKEKYLAAAKVKELMDELYPTDKK